MSSNAPEHAATNPSRRQDPRQMSIQEASPEVARLQVFNDQLARMVDNLRRENEELRLLLAQYQRIAA